MSLDHHVIDHPAEAPKACYSSYPDDASAMAAGNNTNGCAYYNTTYNAVRWFVDGQFRHKPKINWELKVELPADISVNTSSSPFTEFTNVVTNNYVQAGFTTNPYDQPSGTFDTPRKGNYFYQVSFLIETPHMGDGRNFGARVEGQNGGILRYNVEWRKRKLVDGGTGNNLIHYQAEGLIHLNALSFQVRLFNSGTSGPIVVKADPTMTYVYFRET